MLEAKQFEYSLYCLRDFTAHRRQTNIDKIPAYRIVWSHNEHLFTANTYRSLERYPVAYYKSTANEIYKPVIADISSDEILSIFRYVRHAVYTVWNNEFMSLDTVIDKPEALFAYLLQKIDFLSELKKDFQSVDTSYIYNVKNLYSDKILDFSRVPDNFELAPVTLIEEN